MGEGTEMMVARTPGKGTVEVAASRQASEVQMAMFVAKQFPRDIEMAFARIMQACKRQSLAEQALYAYPRGGETVTGPSIRLAEAMAQAWGNLDFGIIELEQAGASSQMMAYCWDLETNTRQTKVFQVPHDRWTKAKGATRLTDPRDVYELTANQGARRLRACILGIIPGDVVEAAIGQCEETMKGNAKEPLVDRVRKMTAAFADIGVSAEMIEKRLGHKLAVTGEAELVGLRKIFTSIRDNMADVWSFFDRPAAAPGSNPLADTVLGKQETPKPAAEAKVAPPPSDDWDEDQPDLLKGKGK